MYEPTFQLKQRPFPAAPSAEHWCDTPSASQSLEQLSAAIQRGLGISLLVGATGTGKTLVLELLARQAASRSQDFVQITCSRLDGRKDLFQRILFELNLPCRDQNESDLRLLAIQHLRGICGQNGRSVLMLIDEAHNLAVELLDELRVLAETAARNTGRCHVVLAGTARLEERLAHADLDAFNQRIVCRAFLESLGRDETAAYIQQHLRRAGGGNRKLFQTEAIARIRELTRGIPRLINQLCDQCLTSCAAIGEKSVSAELAETAWCDLQNLPRHSVVSAAGGPAGNTLETSIEFGTLDDDPPASGQKIFSVRPAAPVIQALEASRPTEVQSRPELAGTPLEGAFAEEAVTPPRQETKRKSSRLPRKTPVKEPVSDPVVPPRMDQAEELSPRGVKETAPEPDSTPAGNELEPDFRIEPGPDFWTPAVAAVGREVQSISAFPPFEVQPAVQSPDLDQESPIEEQGGRKLATIQMTVRGLMAGEPAVDDRALLVPDEVTRYEPTATGEPAPGPETVEPSKQPQRGPHRPRAVRLDYHQLFAQLRENN